MQYPTFDQNQNQPGFAVQHNNPYAQQPQAYLLPNQYAGPQPAVNPQPIVVVVPQQEKQTHSANQVEINQIDRHLSTGGYDFYRCWLYVMLICSGLGSLAVFNGSQNATITIEGRLSGLLLYQYDRGFEI